MGAIQAFNIKEMREKFGLETFVETGTLYGDAVQFALDSGFKTVHSIEINAELAEGARNRFAGNNNVFIHTGNSPDVLRIILPTLGQNTLFWLDAHFPGADARKARMDAETDYGRRMPLEYELQIVAGHAVAYNDLIVCDDLWLYEDGNYESGSFDNHSKTLGFGVTREQVCGRNLDFVDRLFPRDLFTLTKDYRHQGYIILQKKGV